MFPPPASFWTKWTRRGRVDFVKNSAGGRLLGRRLYFATPAQHDWLERLVSEKTYYVSSGTLNSTLFPNIHHRHFIITQLESWYSFYRPVSKQFDSIMLSIGWLLDGHFILTESAVFSTCPALYAHHKPQLDWSSSNSFHCGRWTAGRTVYSDVAVHMRLNAWRQHWRSNVSAQVVLEQNVWVTVHVLRVFTLTFWQIRL